MAIAETLPLDQAVGNGDRQVPLSQIDGLVRAQPASWQPGPFLWERRHAHRMRFSEWLVLVPLDDESEQPCGAPYRVRCRDISLRGIAFSHAAPLEHRKVGLSFVLPGGTAVAVVTRLKWCRFNRDRSYESGGEFVRLAELVAGN